MAVTPKTQLIDLIKMGKRMTLKQQLRLTIWRNCHQS